MTTTAPRRPPPGPAAPAAGDGSVAPDTDGSRTVGRPAGPTGAGAHRIVDLGAAGLASILAAVGFGATWTGGRWMVVVVLAAVVGAACAEVPRGRAATPLPRVAIGAAGLLVAGAVAVPDTAMAGFLPGPSTPAALFDGATRGWSRALTTVPPLRDEDNLLALIWGVVYLATHLAVLLARRTALVAPPAFPALAVSVAAIVLGGAEPRSLALSGVLLAGVLLAWVSARWQRRRRVLALSGSSTDHRRATAAVFLAATTLVGALVGPSLPFVDTDDRLVVRERTEPPFDPARHPSPLSRYPHWRSLALDETGDLEEDLDPVITARGLPEGIPLVLATLDVYDGTAWLVGGGSDGADGTGSNRFERVGGDLASARAPDGSELTGPVTAIAVEITDEGFRGPWVPTPPGATGIEFGGGRSTELQRALRYSRASGNAVLTGHLEPGDTVTVGAEVPAVAHATAAERDRIVGDAPADPAVVLPPIVDPTGALAGRSMAIPDAASGSDLERAVALERRFREEGVGYWQDSISEGRRPFLPGHNAAELEAFLGDGRTFIGDAEKYAASMAVVARQNDLPARVVVGFREHAGEAHAAERSGDVVTFTADHFDAWVEIAFQGHGWVAFDPTPPRTQDDPPAPEQTRPETLETEIQARPPVVPPPDISDLTPQQEEVDDDDRADDARLAGLPSWLVTVLATVLPVLAVILAIGGSIIGWKAWRRRRRRRNGPPAARLHGAWREAVDALREDGVAVASTGTRRQIARGIDPERWDGAPAFADAVDTAMFGPEEPDDVAVEAVWRDVDGLRALTRSRRGRIGKLLLALSPKTLAGWR